jgi:hypothetical protein
MASNGAGNDVGGEKLWEHADPQSTHMWKFMQDVNTNYGLKLNSYNDLYDWSINNISRFWGEVWETTGVKASQPYNQVDITVPDNGDRNSALSTPDRSSMNQLLCSHALPGLLVQNSTSRRTCSSRPPRNLFSNLSLPL